MKVNREKLAKLVTVTLKCEEEDRTFRGEFERENGQPDHEIEEWIAKELRNGNPWAWCSAHVVVTYKGFKGEDWLGGCSYRSEADFMQPDGYYDSMISEAVGRLAEQIDAVVDRPDIWIHTNPYCLMCIVDGTST